MPEKPRYKLPQLLQNVEAESGAVALGIALACHGKTCTLRELSSASGITRDGITPEKLLKAAESFGLVGQWESLNNDETADKRIQSLRDPAISIDSRNCYGVILASHQDCAEIYNTANGRQQQELKEFRGTQLLPLKTTSGFSSSQRTPFWQSTFKSVIPLRRSVLALFLLSTGSVIPTLMIAACSSQFIDQFLQQNRLSFGIPIVWLALIALSLSVCMALLSNLLLRRMVFVLERRMADEVFETLFTRSYRFLTLRKPGDLASRLMYPYYMPYTGIFSFLSPILGLWTALLIVVFSAFISFPLFLLLLLGFVVILRASYVVTSNTADNLTVRQKANNSRYATAFQLINNLYSFKGNGTEFSMLQKWQSFFAEGVYENQIIGKQKVKRNVTINGTIFATQVLLLGIGGLLIIQGSVSLGSLLAFVFIQGQISDSLQSIPAISNGWQSLQGLLLLYDDLCQGEQDSWHRGLDRSDDDNNSKRSSNNMNNLEITMNDLGCRFSQFDEPVLKNFSNHISQGEQILLSGDSGSGKTVLMKIISGLLEHTEGELLVNGKPMTSIDSRQWHRKVSYVDENPSLFSGNLLENITAWRMDCHRSDATRAADVVGLTDWIERFEAGFEHHLENAEQILCSSQKIQFAIARALCGRPRVLLLDVDTSKLRKQDEQRIHSHCREESITLVSLSERGMAKGYDRVMTLKRKALT
ncbi:ATP-binding cassette domain-containing protein [Synechococcus sp. UW179A]|uniref:ATP-binding cassette domain-containing protein n=1 Tax=Synechococcus sp. UW179A TaxID=2575510 RepID=UPI000E0FB8A6|nr:ATP-binding cassette domain-containing protein [Synechococcus sp. UW179A]